MAPTMFNIPGTDVACNLLVCHFLSQYGCVSCRLHLLNLLQLLSPKTTHDVGARVDRPVTISKSLQKLLSHRVTLGHAEGGRNMNGALQMPVDLESDHALDLVARAHSREVIAPPHSLAVGYQPVSLNSCECIPHLRWPLQPFQLSSRSIRCIQSPFELHDRHVIIASEEQTELLRRHFGEVTLLRSRAKHHDCKMEEGELQSSSNTEVKTTDTGI